MDASKITEQVLRGEILFLNLFIGRTQFDTKLLVSNAWLKFEPNPNITSVEASLVLVPVHTQMIIVQGEYTTKAWFDAQNR